VTPGSVSTSRLVELHRQVAHGCVATGGNIGKDAFDRGADLGVIRSPFRLGLAALEPGDRHGSLV
jgi:hypothetical protein